MSRFPLFDPALHHNFHCPAWTARRRTRGVALVLVLAFLVLITGLIIAFFTSVTNDLVTAKTATGEVLAKQLADSTTQIVEAQIRTATSYGGTSAWASQPGMIRVYDSDGNAQAYYKLYSSDKMALLQNDATAFQLTDDVFPDWAKNPSLYVDLNSPVMKTNPGGAVDPANPSATPAPTAVFPIIDPNAKATNPASATDGVEGFNFSGNDLKTGQPAMNGVVFDQTQPNSARLPMPVRWLYVLRDGSLTTPDNDSQVNQAIFKKAAAALQPTNANPIVGRVAFWTDDETSKVNINTASEGTFWDVPYAFTTEDSGTQNGGAVGKPGLAVSQPAQGEFQRYPGHPAQTSLSSVFGFFLQNPNSGGTKFPAIDAAGAKLLERYYQMVPRIVGGGSAGGTAVADKVLRSDSDRLYASIDELMFQPNRAQNPPQTAPNPPNLTQDVLEKARFFITANSRAPEVNQFNLPRIAIWPEWLDEDKRTTKDKLLAFCSTIGLKTPTSPAYPYYFTRQDPRSSTADNSARNDALYRYLQRLTSQKVPGFGQSTFLAKFGPGSSGITDRDQILTSIYDYIRSTNLNDSTGTPNTKQGPYTVSTAKPGDPQEAGPGFGEVVPIEIPVSATDPTGPKTRGFGRTDTITQAAVVIYPAYKSLTTASPASTTYMRAILLLENSGVMQGLCTDFPNLCHVISGLDQFKLTPIDAAGVSSPALPMNFPNKATNFIESPASFGFHGRAVGGLEGFMMTLGHFTGLSGLGNENTGAKFATSNASGVAQRGNYPFFSKDVPIPPTATKMDFSGGTIQIEVRTADTNLLLQTFTMTFPALKGLVVPTATVTATVPPDFIKDRIDNGSKVGNDGIYQNLFRDTDTIISLELAGTKGNANDAASDATAGDVRMIASLKTVGQQYFRPHPSYSTATSTALLGARAHALMVDLGQFYNYGTGSKLVRGVADYGMYGGATNVRDKTIRNSSLSSRVGNTGVTRSDNSNGDWDTGTGGYKDGAYINKPDDGDVLLSGTRVPYFDSEYVNQSAGQANGSQTFFSPNRQISSPIMFGSIPTGVQRFRPWETLLFHPDTKHPDWSVPPKDHLLADLFWMPVVEPYAISEPFSTAGKINMNYQLMPFGNYIRRDTGLRAVFKATKFMGLRTADAHLYKPHNYGSNNPPVAADTRRNNIDPQATLDNGFENARFRAAKPEIFRSASEICDVDLYAPNQTSMTNFWLVNSLTGDNLRERPYSDLYSRLTTKSNTFSVHLIAQSLRQSISEADTGNANWAVWNEPKDQVLGQYRGSSIIERYIDVNDTALQSKDFATNTDPKADTSPYYKFRVVSTKQFGQ